MSTPAPLVPWLVASRIPAVPVAPSTAPATQSAPLSYRPRAAAAAAGGEHTSRGGYAPQGLAWPAVVSPGGFSAAVVEPSAKVAAAMAAAVVAAVAEANGGRMYAEGREKKAESEEEGEEDEEHVDVGDEGVCATATLDFLASVLENPSVATAEYEDAAVGAPGSGGEGSSKPCTIGLVTTGRGPGRCVAAASAVDGAAANPVNTTGKGATPAATQDGVNNSGTPLRPQDVRDVAGPVIAGGINGGGRESPSTREKGVRRLSIGGNPSCDMADQKAAAAATAAGDGPKSPAGSAAVISSTGAGGGSDAIGGAPMGAAVVVSAAGARGRKGGSSTASVEAGGGATGGRPGGRQGARRNASKFPDDVIAKVRARECVRCNGRRGCCRRRRRCYRSLLSRSVDGEFRFCRGSSL